MSTTLEQAVIKETLPKPVTPHKRELAGIAIQQGVEIGFDKYRQALKKIRRYELSPEEKAEYDLLESLMDDAFRSAGRLRWMLDRQYGKGEG